MVTNPSQVVTNVCDDIDHDVMRVAEVSEFLSFLEPIILWGDKAFILFVRSFAPVFFLLNKLKIACSSKYIVRNGVVYQSITSRQCDFYSSPTG